MIGETVQISINLYSIDNSFDIPSRNNGTNEYSENFLF
jgi:hypothetical protein